MTKLRLRRYALVLGTVLLIPPIVWTGVVLIAPTGWAKQHVLEALEAGTKRSIRLERLSVGWLGGIRLKNVEVSSPANGADPWLKAQDLELDISFWDVIQGKLRKRSVAVSGVDLRVLRRADGAFEIADQIISAETRANSSHVHRALAPVNVQIRGANISVVDEPSHSRLHMQDVECEGVLEEGRIAIPSMRGVINGGPFQIVGEFDRSGPEPRFEGRFRADDVVLDDGMSIIRYAVPVLAGAPLNLKGHIDTEVSLAGHGATAEAITNSLAGTGMIAINPIDLDGAPLITELSKIAEMSRQGRIASIHSDFAIKDRRVTTDHFTLNVGRAPLTLAGWTSFDGQIEYHLNFKGLTDRLPDKARRLLGELDIDLGSRANLTLRGTVNQMVVQFNGVSLDRTLMKAASGLNKAAGGLNKAAAGLNRDDREKLRSLGRRFLDQLDR